MKIAYTNFHHHITYRHGVVIEGWPFAQFCQPSEIKSTTELECLFNMLKSGTTRFVKLDSETLESYRMQRMLEGLKLVTQTEPVRVNPEEDARYKWAVTGINDEAIPIVQAEKSIKSKSAGAKKPRGKKRKAAEMGECRGPCFADIC